MQINKSEKTLIKEKVNVMKDNQNPNIKNLYDLMFLIFEQLELILKNKEVK